eukprot:1150130-Pelagomonas_calceolata.AAC.8
MLSASTLFQIHIHATYSLDQASMAHKDLEERRTKCSRLFCQDMVLVTFKSVLMAFLPRHGARKDPIGTVKGNPTRGCNLCGEGHTHNFEIRHDSKALRKQNMKWLGDRNTIGNTSYINQGDGNEFGFESCCKSSPEQMKNKTHGPGGLGMELERKLAIISREKF